MRVVCVFKEGRDYSRTVTDWLEDFYSRTGEKIETIDPDTEPGFCEAYGIMQHPTVLALGKNGETVSVWHGLPLPLFDEISYYKNA